MTFRDWYDIDWLEFFFRNNMDDLESWFHITDMDGIKDISSNE